ncbi:YheT family hydrolase [Acidovorax sp.]|uniref:YheT family hydrolase n=1 Tax=Acidovorax sp. TaxID=1872122 RepID=UPI003918A9EB
MKYVAPRWLPGGQLQTIWPALASRRVFGARPVYRRERWDTPDGDFVDVDFLDDGAQPSARAEPLTQAARPLLVVFHGLEGSSRSHYCEAFADLAREQGWACALPHFRGCSGEINRAPRAYHSGDYAEIGWMLQRLRAAHTGPLMAVGVSLGGNALLRWAAEVGSDAARSADAVAAVCSPIDLAAGGHAIGRGFNRQIYTRMFMRTLVPKALAKLAQHPGLFDRDALLSARDLYAFDNVFTAPLHGYRNTEDYWQRASAKPLLRNIRIPALVVNARNDPFVPASSLPGVHEVGPCVTLWQPAHGGHVGFAQGRLPGHVRAMPDAVGAWLAAQTDTAGMPAPAQSRHG